MGDANRSVTIALTEDQRHQIHAVIGREVTAVEVGSDGEDDEWIVLVWESRPQAAEGGEAR